MSRAAGSSWKPRGPMPPCTHFTDEGHESQRVPATCTGSPSCHQSKRTQFFTTATIKHFQSRQVLCIKNIPPHKEFTVEIMSYKPASHENFLITKHQKKPNVQIHPVPSFDKLY